MVAIPEDAAAQKQLTHQLASKPYLGGTCVGRAEKIPMACDKCEVSVQVSKYLILPLGHFSRIPWPLILLS